MCSQSDEGFQSPYLDRLERKVDVSQHVEELEREILKVKYAYACMRVCMCICLERKVDVSQHVGELEREILKVKYAYACMRV